MSELLKATSGANASTSGDVNVGETSNSTSGEADNLESLKRAYEKALKEKKNVAMLAQDQKAKLEDYERKERDLEEAKLLQQKQHEIVILNLKKDLEKTQSELKTERETIKKARINTAFLSELKKFGFIDNENNKEAALRLASFKGVEIDPSTNTVVGVDDEVKNFYEKFGTLGLFEKKASTTSSAAPSYNKNVGSPDINSMSKQEKLQLLAILASKK